MPRVGHIRMDSDALIERERELAAVGELLDRTRRGSGGLLVVEGAPGVGKSSLLAAAADEGRDRGMNVLSACSAEIEREFAFGVTFQLFEAASRAPDAAPGLAALLGEATGHGPAQGGEPALLRIAHGFYQAAASLAEVSPLLISIDDAHWADEPSLRFLNYIARRAGDLPIALLAAVRPATEPSGPLADLLAQPDVRVIQPAPLSPEGVARLVRLLLGDEADDAFCATCCEVTGGNPFLLQELVSVLADEGIAPSAESSTRVSELTPDAVTREILVRLTRLGDEGAALARALAVMGDDARLDPAARLAGIDADLAAAAADALAAADIVAGEERISFVHPLVRAAVYSDLGPAERARMHAGAARILDEEGSSAETVASHLLRAVRRRDARAVDVLRAAARRASARGAASFAAEYLRRASEEPPPPEERGDVLVELAEAEAAAGDPGALGRLDEALDLVDEPPRRAAIMLSAGRLLYMAGETAAATRSFQRALDEVGDGDGALAAEARAALAGVRLVAESSFEDAAPLLELLEAVGPDPTPAQRELLAQAALAGLMTLRVTHEEAVELCERALGGTALLEQETSDGMALYSVTGVLYACDEFDREVELMDAAIEDARRRGSVLGFATASYIRASALYGLGRLPEALADVEAALDAGRYGWDLYVPAARHLLAILLIEHDDLEAAERALDFDIEGLESLARPMVLRARGQLRSEQGRWEEALGDLLESGRHDPFRLFSGPNPWRSNAAIAATRLGQREQAIDLVAEELALARRWGAPRGIALALRGQGLVEAGTAGVEPLREAVALLEGSPAALDRTRILVELGTVLRSTGERREARRALERAIDEARACGALRLGRKAREELEVAGGKPRREQFVGIEALTPSERRVAQMAADGMTNREIAQALFVTVKAVEKHLGNTYVKLGVGSRRELSKALEAGGQAAPGA